MNRINIRDIPTEKIAELLEDYTIEETAQILRCSRSGLQYQMKRRDLKSTQDRGPRHIKRLRRAAIKRFGYTDNDALIEIIKDLGRKLGRRPTVEDLENTAGYPCKAVFANRFGSWTEALELAGYRPKLHNHSRYDIADSVLLDLLREFAEELGHRPRRRDLFGRNSYPSVRVYELRFGSWTEALERAGFEVARIKHKKSRPRPIPLEEKIYNRITSRLRFAVLKRDGFRCRYCGRSPEDGIILTLDHVIPESKGGLTT